MAKTTKLTTNITEKEFDKGYWYASEIKAFAKQLGIANSSRLRKDELEQLIKHFLRTGPIIHYTSNKQTKNFIKAESNKLIPGLKIKSEVWYRLNRWRGISEA